MERGKKEGGFLSQEDKNPARHWERGFSSRVGKRIREREKGGGVGNEGKRTTRGRMKAKGVSGDSNPLGGKVLNNSAGLESLRERMAEKTQGPYGLNGPATGLGRNSGTN